MAMFISTQQEELVINYLKKLSESSPEAAEVLGMFMGNQSKESLFPGGSQCG